MVRKRSNKVKEKVEEMEKEGWNGGKKEGNGEVKRKEWRNG